MLNYIVDYLEEEIDSISLNFRGFGYIERIQVERGLFLVLKLLSLERLQYNLQGFSKAHMDSILSEVQNIKGLNIVTQPTMNVIGLESNTVDISRVAEELRLRKWAVSLFPHHIRIVIMPHTKEQHIEQFLEDLNRIVDELRG